MPEDTLLDQMRKVVREEMRTEREETRKLVREEVEVEGKQILAKQTLMEVSLKAKVIGVENRLKDIEIANSRMEKGQERLEAKIDKVQETVDIVQSVMVEHHQNLETRVSQLEEDHEFPHRH